MRLTADVALEAASGRGGSDFSSAGVIGNIVGAIVLSLVASRFGRRGAHA